MSVNLSRIISRTGKKVLLVDFDLHKPKIHKVLKLDTKIGNSNFLSGSVSLNDLIQEFEENLFVLPCGVVPPNPSELVLSDRVDQIIEYAKDNFDYLFLDTPPRREKKQ